jgi:16S rRNA (cytosine967-C5)-methyltransferase
VLSEDAPFPRAWLQRGEGMVQDRSSQALMAYQWEQPVTRILDACAAPGGKTTALARRHPGAELVALEQDGKRARRLRENLQARGVAAQVVEAEAGRWLAQGGAPFDLILLDAPCSGSGTFQKHPELPWTGGSIDLGRLATVQRTLLTAALERLAPGGLLIYAVCSWLPEEGERHRRWALSAHPALRPVEAWPDRGGAELHLDPMTWEGEGFQAFAMTRIPG